MSSDEGKHLWHSLCKRPFVYHVWELFHCSRKELDGPECMRYHLWLTVPSQAKSNLRQKCHHHIPRSKKQQQSPFRLLSDLRFGDMPILTTPLSSQWTCKELHLSSIHKSQFSYASFFMLYSNCKFAGQIDCFSKALCIVPDAAHISRRLTCFCWFKKFCVL